MADKRDYYEVLGVDKNADESAIKSAYRKLAKQYHPDVNPGDKTAEAKFKEVGEAYEVLSDAEKRKRYDQFGHAGVDPNFGAGQPGGGFAGGFAGNMDLNDIFETFFGGAAGAGGFGGFGGGQRSATAPRRGADIRVSMPLSFMEAAQGVKKNITIDHRENCPVCAGSGAAAGTTAETCPTCHGAGVVMQQRRTPFGVMQTSAPCPQCGGKGKIIKTPCTNCSGSGQVNAKHTLEVNIPAGIDDGQSVALRGQGHAGENGGPTGDVLVTVTLRPDPLFQREGYDVHVNVPITYAQAALGAQIVVPTVDGKVQYNVPAGTQPETVFRLRGKGIKQLNGRGRGDQYVKVTVEVPRQINPSQRTALESFDKSLTEENYQQRKGFFSMVRDLFGGQS